MVPKFSGNKSCKNQESSFDYWLKVILPFSNERGKMLSCHEIMLFMEVEWSYRIECFFSCIPRFTKPHPLSSPVNKYSSLIRAQTFSSVLDNVDIPVETSSARNFSKAPLRLKFALSPKGMPAHSISHRSTLQYFFCECQMSLSCTLVNYKRETNLAYSLSVRVVKMCQRPANCVVESVGEPLHLLSFCCMYNT